MSLPECKTLLLSEENGILHVTLNRPEVRNAMSLVMLSELLEAFDYAENAELRALVLRGAEGNLSSGGDIKDMAIARMQWKEGIAEVSRQFGMITARIIASPMMIITIAEGAVMGGGFGAVCASDLTICSRDVCFSLPETTIGIVPSQIAPYLVERIGFAQAKRLALTGARVGADEALRIGLVHEVAEDVDAALAKLLSDVRRCAPGANATTKAILRVARLAPPETMIDQAAKVFAEAVTSPEGQEGTVAFVEKRKPGWAEDS